MTAISELRRAGDDLCASFLRELADDISSSIRQRDITAATARELAETLRFQASLLLPERIDVYDRIYGARFERLIAQFNDDQT